MADRVITGVPADEEAQYRSRACARARSASTSARTASATTCRCRLPRPGAAARRSITSCCTARPGLGKTTLAYVIGAEMGVPVKATAGPVIEKPGDLAAMLTDLQAHEVLFIDEIHRMPPAIEEILYPAMEDYELDVMIGQGPGAKSVKVSLQKFTLVGATTRAGLLTSPLRARFGIVHRLDFYNERDIVEIVRRSARILGVPIDDDAARRNRPPLARHAAHRQPSAAPRARLRAGAGRRADLGGRGAGGADAARSRRARLRRGGSQAAAHDHRQVRRRAGGRQQPGRRHSRREGRDRGHLRAVPDPGRVPRSHAAWPRRHRRAPTSISGSPSRGRIRVCGNRRPAHRVPCAHREPRDLRSRPSCSPTPISRRWSRRATSGSSSAPASARATSPSRASGTSELATKAALLAIERAGLTPDQIDFIVVGTTTPDMMFPSTACLVQHNIGATNAWGYDLLRGVLRLHLRAHHRGQHGVHRREQARPGDRRRRDVEHHRLHRPRHLRHLRRRRRRRGRRGDQRRGHRHHRLRQLRRRQRRREPLHAGRRQPPAGLARHRRSAAPLREAGRPGRVPLRRPQHRGSLPPAARTQRRDGRPISTSSSRTRPTGASSSPRPRSSSCRWRRW